MIDDAGTLEIRVVASREEAYTLRGEGFCPVDVGFSWDDETGSGAESLLDSLMIGTWITMKPGVFEEESRIGPAMTAYRNHGARKNDPRFIVIDEPNEGSSLAIAALAGIIPSLPPEGGGGAAHTANRITKRVVTFVSGSARDVYEMVKDESVCMCGDFARLHEPISLACVQLCGCNQFTYDPLQEQYAGEAILAWRDRQKIEERQGIPLERRWLCAVLDWQALLAPDAPKHLKKEFAAAREAEMVRRNAI